jgi:2-amino-4-hydroxy-6-hydroxymethyldihydropteridine diphosphokinase
VAHIHTELTPLELLDALQQQERDQGREKLRHWGERCIDLDILLYDDLQLRSERLNIPHLELAKRSFVVVPLAELTPELQLPNGQLITQIAPEFNGELQKLHRLVIDL